MMKTEKVGWKGGIKRISYKQQQRDTCSRVRRRLFDFFFFLNKETQTNKSLFKELQRINKSSLSICQDF